MKRKKFDLTVGITFEQTTPQTLCLLFNPWNSSVYRTGIELIHSEPDWELRCYQIRVLI